MGKHETTSLSRTSPTPWHVIVRRPENLRRTSSIAAIVGTILFSINQLDTVLSGGASTATWIKGATTYLVPFVVSNLGVVHGVRMREVDERAGQSS